MNKLAGETYQIRKEEIEKKISNFIDKKVDLGEYSGLRFLNDI